MYSTDKYNPKFEVCIYFGMIMHYVFCNVVYQYNSFMRLHAETRGQTQDSFFNCSYILKQKNVFPSIVNQKASSFCGTKPKPTSNF